MRADLLVADPFTLGGRIAVSHLLSLRWPCASDAYFQSILLRDPLHAGITINTSPSDFAPIKQMQMERFNSESFELFGPVMAGKVGGGG
jgi:hypothetical protein